MVRSMELNAKLDQKKKKKKKEKKTTKKLKLFEWIWLLITPKEITWLSLG